MIAVAHGDGALAPLEELLPLIVRKTHALFALKGEEQLLEGRANGSLVLELRNAQLRQLRTL